MEKSTIYSSAPKPPKQIRVEENPVEPTITEQVLPENKEEQPAKITVMQPTVSNHTVVKLNTERQPEQVLTEKPTEEPLQSELPAENLPSTEEANPYEVLQEATTTVEAVLEQMPDPERNSTEEQMELGEADNVENVTAATQTTTETETAEIADPEKYATEEQNELAEIAAKENDDSIVETQETEVATVIEEPKAVDVETSSAEALDFTVPEQQIEEEIKTVSETKSSAEKVSRSPRHKTEPEYEFENLKIPGDEELFQRQYYTMGEVATMFHANQSQIRFWENEFDILQPKKNKKGDRYFRPEDVKNLQVIHHLLRNRRFTIEGAREYLKSNKQRTQDTVAAIASLGQLKAFLTELKASL